MASIPEKIAAGLNVPEEIKTQSVNVSLRLNCNSCMHFYSGEDWTFNIEDVHFNDGENRYKKPQIGKIFKVKPEKQTFRASQEDHLLELRA
eukprot:Gb_24092 [translate_table: standard]